MPEIPENAVLAAERAIGQHMILRESPGQIARAAIEAAAPALAEAVAAKILAHMDEHGPGDRTSISRALSRTWRRHFGIAARIAAGTFMTEDDIGRSAAAALASGDYVACRIPEEEAGSDDGQ